MACAAQQIAAECFGERSRLWNIPDAIAVEYAPGDADLPKGLAVAAEFCQSPAPIAKVLDALRVIHRALFIMAMIDKTFFILGYARLD